MPYSGIFPPNSRFRACSEILPIPRFFAIMGVGFGYSMIAYLSTLKGFGKLKLREEILARDLDNAWEVMAEPIQTVMRKAGIEKPYEKLKDLTRGQDKITKETIQQFVEGLELSADDKQRLLDMSPASYVGMAGQIVDNL